MRRKERVGDITSREYLVMLGDKVLGAFDSEEAAQKYAERSGGTVKKIEWKFAGKSK